MSHVLDFSSTETTLNVGATRPERGGLPGLRATSVRNGSAMIVTVVGELDASNEDFWSHLLSKMGLAATTPGPFVVDVRGLRFMSRGAFHILAREAQRCRRRGFNLCLVSNRPVVARTVAACGLRPVLMIYPTVDAALSQSAAPPCGDDPLTLARQ